MYIYEVFMVSARGLYSLMATFANREEAFGYAERLKGDGAARVVVREADYHYNWNEYEVGKEPK